MAIPNYGQMKDGDALDSLVNNVTQNYMDYAAGYQGNLTNTGAAITDTEADSAASSASAANILAAQLAPGAVNTVAHDGGAAGSVYLPPAIKDTHLVAEITGDIDQTGALTFFTRGASGAGTSVVFAKQVVGLINGATASSIETLGTYDTPTSIKLIYTAAAADTNFLGAGSVIHFYAPVADEWLVKIYAIPEGTGATGAMTTSAS